MKNAITGNYYTGTNEEILAEAGVEEVVTFKQALKVDGISGKDLKGIKKAATLIRFDTKNVEEDEDGNTRPRPIFFAVFDYQDVIARRAA